VIETVLKFIPSSSAAWRGARYIAENLAVFCVYVALGRLSQTLGLVPGYASPVYLPSGVALAALLIGGARVLPALVVAAVLLPLGNELALTPRQSWSTMLAVASAIGAGAMTQAVVRAALVRRLVGYPTPLSKTSDIARFLLIVGPLGCLINASSSLALLHAIGRIDRAGLPYAWINWWAGDAIGALALTPVALCLFGEPRQVWRRRLPVVAAPLLIALALAVFVAYRLRLSERDQMLASFRAKSESLVASFQVGLERYVDLLHVVSAQVGNAPRSSSERFRDIAKTMLPLYPGLQALAWAEHHENPGLGPAPADCTERSGDKRLVPCDRRALYDIVRAIQPLAGNAPALAYDLSSNAVRRIALRAAQASRRPTATSLIVLVQGTDSKPGFLVVMPVDDGAGGTRGFVNAVFLSHDVVQAVLKPFVSDDMAVDVSMQDDGGYTRVYRSDEDGGGSFDRRYAVTLPAAVSSADAWTFVLTMAPSAGYVADRPRPYSWAAVLGGLLFVGSLTYS
jgi:integral membrane sensor domain MASE1